MPSLYDVLLISWTQRGGQRGQNVYPVHLHTLDCCWDYNTSTCSILTYTVHNLVWLINSTIVVMLIIQHRRDHKSLELICTRATSQWMSVHHTLCKKRASFPLNNKKSSHVEFAQRFGFHHKSSHKTLHTSLLRT